MYSYSPDAWAVMYKDGISGAKLQPQVHGGRVVQQQHWLAVVGAAPPPDGAGCS